MGYKAAIHVGGDIREPIIPPGIPARRAISQPD
jgi:hypothetical protein